MLPVHFGLDKAAKVETLEIRSPSGPVQAFRHIPANVYLTVVEGKRASSRRASRGQADRPTRAGGEGGRGLGMTRRTLWLIALGVVVAAGAVTATAISWARKDREHALYTQIGQEINLLLKRYAGEFERKDLERLLGFYADDYKAPQSGRWEPEITTTKDGVQSGKWVEVARQDRDKASLKEQLAAYLATFGELAKGKQRFKIDMIEGTPTDREAVFTSKVIVRGFDAQKRPLEDKAFIRFWISKRGIAIRNELPEWLITRHELVRGERTIGSGNLFVDIAESAGIAFKHQKDPALANLKLKFAHAKWVPGGVAVADYNNSGFQSIFFADGVESKLYRNNADGTYTDVTKEAGLGGIRTGSGVWGDYDNDGCIDLFVTGYMRTQRLFKNNCDGTFTEVTKQAGLEFNGFGTAAAWADYNRDGYVDLYVGHYIDPRTVPQTYLYARNGPKNRLYRNNGNGTFTDVTDEAGVGDTGLTLALSWGDYDNDGWPDLYVGNDFGRNTLYRNLGNGKFKDVTLETGTADIGFAMSVAWGDFNNTGRLSLHVSNIYSNQRWFAEPITIATYIRNSIRSGYILQDWKHFWEIYQIMGKDGLTIGRKSGRGNSLLRNNGDGTFTDIAREAEVDRVGWGWGAAFFDYDNDGRQDLFSANGWITQKSGTDL
jgi:hypothetical protein